MVTLDTDKGWSPKINTAIISCWLIGAVILGVGGLLFEPDLLIPMAIYLVIACMHKEV